ncbi:MAG TPA: hypothetical protein VGV92_03715 [Gammaproteobacteria bacterium]|nr:hypothetical protein [Gammaproteobacteria bacterium]
MSNETPGEETALVEKSTSKRASYGTFFGSYAGALVAIVPNVIGAIAGQNDPYHAALTASAAGVVLLTAATKMIHAHYRGELSCGTSVLLNGVELVASGAAQIFSTANLVLNPNAFTAFANVGTNVMLGATVADSAMRCTRK